MHNASHPQLANTLSAESLFYTCIIPFIMFFGSFAAIMYPLRDVLHPTGALASCKPCTYALQVMKRVVNLLISITLR